MTTEEPTNDCAHVWVANSGRGREPQCAPDPNYPNGIAVGMASPGEMNDKQRELIGTALREQAARYLPPNPALTGKTDERGTHE